MLPDYYQLIDDWFSRAKKEEEVFTKFIFLYISFNAFINQTREEFREREKIEYLKNNESAKYFYINLIRRDNFLYNIMNGLKSYLDNKPIINSTGGRGEWIGNDGKLRNSEDWENLVEYWYRVRNNLFHGHKIHNFDRDQRLVKYAYLTLLPLMENFVSHNMQWDFD